MGDDDDKPVKRERGERGGKNRPSKKAWQARNRFVPAPRSLIPALVPPPHKAATQVPRPIIPALVLPPPKAATAGCTAKSGAPVVVAAASVVVAAAVVLPKAAPVVVLPKAAPVVVAAALVLPKATPSLLAAALVSPEATTGVLHLKHYNDLFSCCLCAVPSCYVQARADVCVFCLRLLFAWWCERPPLIVLVVCLRAFC